MYEYVNQGRRLPKRRSVVRPSDRAARALAMRESGAAVVTVIEPDMRRRMDAATDGLFAAVHVESVAEALDAVRSPSVQALLVSPGVVREESVLAVSRLGLACPGVLTIAVLGDRDVGTGEGLLELGACGVRWIIDLAEPDGWNRLRSVVVESRRAGASSLLHAIMPALGDASPGVRRFFEALVRTAPRVGTVRDFAQTLRVSATTLNSSFFRAVLPSPRRYLVEIRLLYAISYFERTTTSIVDVANRLDYSTPQSFVRHVRGMLGISMGEFRMLELGSAVADFTSRLVLPYQGTFRRFDPLGRARRG